MAESTLPCPTVMRLLVRYEPETGHIFWRKRPAWTFATTRSFRAWNTKFAGTEAINADRDGYRIGRVMGVAVSAHRAAFAIITGRWPTIVDHRNGIRSDNRWINLREATGAQNAVNRGANKIAKSAFKGVTWDKKCGLWRSLARIDGKTHSLGRYTSEQDAARAYDIFAIEHHGEYAKLNIPGAAWTPERPISSRTKSMRRRDEIATLIPEIITALRTGLGCKPIGARFHVSPSVVSEIGKAHGIMRGRGGYDTWKMRRQRSE